MRGPGSEQDSNPCFIVSSLVWYHYTIVAGHQSPDWNLYSILVVIVVRAAAAVDADPELSLLIGSPLLYRKTDALNPLFCSLIGNCV